MFVNIMPYSLKNIPDKIKGLPAHAQKVWIEAFNNALKLYKNDEGKANMTAWSAVKKAGYEQDKDGKWHKVKEARTRDSFKLSEAIQLGQKLKLKDILEELKEGKADYGQLLQYQQVAVSLKGAGDQHSKEDNGFLNQIIAICQESLKSKKQEAKMDVKKIDKKNIQDLKEADIKIEFASLKEAGVSFDKETGNLKLTVTEGGWSKNENYWTQEAINDLPAVFTDKRKVYVDHKMDGHKPRSIRDWAAQLIKSHVQDNAFKAEVHLFDKPFDWLKERIDKFPEEVGLSVDVRAKVSQGEREGRKGQIVERVVIGNSFDFVAEASAGGKVDEMLESIWETQMKELPVQDVLELAEGELGELIDAQDKSDELWKIWSALRKLFASVGRTIGQDETAKKKRIADALDEFKSIILKFDPAVFVAEQRTSDKSIEEVKEVEVKELNVLNLTQIRPDLITEIKELAIKEFKEDKEIDKGKKELERLQKENKTMAKDLDDFKVKETEQKKQEEIDKELEESKLDKRHITEQFIKDLMAAETKEQRDAKIKDRMELVSTVKDPGKVKNHGERKIEGEKDKDQPTMSDEKAAKEVSA